MAFLLLLALLCSAAFAYAAPGRGTAQAAARLGFGFLAIGLLAQLVLGFELNEDFARLFYLARYMLTATWLGQAALLLLYPKQVWVRRALWGLAAASVASLVLIGATQITQAQDWYQPTSPAYSQIHELLATNRPTRWGAAALSAYGLLALLGAAAAQLRRGRAWGAACLAAGAALLAAPLLWPPRSADQAFYAVELAAPVLLYLGLTAEANAHTRGRK